jgi:hypothetical protein
MELKRLDGKGNMSLEQNVTKQSTVMLTHITRKQGVIWHYNSIIIALSRRFRVGGGAVVFALRCKSDLILSSAL